MPRYYSNRRSRRRRTGGATTIIQHSPSSMGNLVPTNDQLVTFMAVANVFAGGSMTTDRTDENRLTDVPNGRNIGRTTWNVGFEVGSETQSGYIEYCVFKAERQHGTPVVGTDPLPTDAEVISLGLQAMYRNNLPGWVIKFGLIPITSETIVTREISVSWSKFKKQRVKDGDFYGIVFFNRTGVNVTIDWQCRYKTFG